MIYKDEVWIYIGEKYDSGIPMSKIAKELKMDMEITFGLYRYYRSLKEGTLVIIKEGRKTVTDDTISVRDLKNGWFKKHGRYRNMRPKGFKNESDRNEDEEAYKHYVISEYSRRLTK